MKRKRFVRDNLGVLLFVFVVFLPMVSLIGLCTHSRAVARSPGLLVCAFDGKETLRVRISEGWQTEPGNGWLYEPHGGRFTSYWPVGGETCEIQR